VRRRDDAGVPFRIADPLIGLSTVGDLARGLPVGHAARTCFVACRLAAALGAEEGIVREAFYASLLQHVGCVAHAHDSVGVDGGRTIVVNAAVDRTDFSRPADVFGVLLAELSPGVLGRVRLLLPAARLAPVFLRTSCEVAELTARQVGLPPGVQTAVRHVSEWFNGRGGFLHVRGDDIPLAARVVLVAFTASVFDELSGPGGAIDVVRGRAGGILDPAVADAFVRGGREILSELNAIDLLDALPGVEPEPVLCVPDTRLDELAIAVGEVVDLKSPFTHGSARRACDLTRLACATLGLDAPTVAEAGRAAALRDVGKAALPNAVIEKPSGLTEAEWESVRLHAYHSERVLGRSPSLVAEARLAGLHHETEDGTGYHRGLRGDSVPMAAKVVAAADALVAMTQPRPYRAALHLDEAFASLTARAREGQLHPDAVGAVIAAAGGRRTVLPRRSAPTELSDRQVEVLRLVAQGLSNPEIARQLVVSRRTAEHHVQDVYRKIGVSSRAAAALYAVHHDLL
jgi:HD-GYP domain-containing protein (c-di-GMP phosphodiesterase class II)